MRTPLPQSAFLAALAVAAAVSTSGCAPRCSSACEQLLNKCKVSCSTIVIGGAGYEGAKNVCEADPSRAGCFNLPR